MTPAERARRSRAKAKEARQTITPPNAMHPTPAACTHVVAAAHASPRAACVPPASALDLLAGDAEAIAARIFDAVSVETARGITVALQRRLMQGGSWPPWLPRMLS